MVFKCSSRHQALGAVVGGAMPSAQKHVSSDQTGVRCRPSSLKHASLTVQVAAARCLPGRQELLRVLRGRFQGTCQFQLNRIRNCVELCVLSSVRQRPQYEDSDVRRYLSGVSARAPNAYRGLLFASCPLVPSCYSSPPVWTLSPLVLGHVGLISWFDDDSTAFLTILDAFPRGPAPH